MCVYRIRSLENFGESGLVKLAIFQHKLLICSETKVCYRLQWLHYQFESLYFTFACYCLLLVIFHHIFVASGNPEVSKSSEKQLKL